MRGGTRPHARAVIHQGLDEGVVPEVDLSYLTVAGQVGPGVADVRAASGMPSRRSQAVSQARSNHGPGPRVIHAPWVRPQSGGQLSLSWPKPDAPAGRVEDQLRVDADPRLGDPECRPLADELQRPGGGSGQAQNRKTWRFAVPPPPPHRRIGPVGSESSCGLSLLTIVPSESRRLISAARSTPRQPSGAACTTPPSQPGAPGRIRRVSANSNPLV